MAIVDANGNGRRSLADSAALVVAARLMTIAGIPVAGFFGAWAFITLVGLQKDVAVISSRVDTLVAHYYSSSDATKDFALRDAQIGNNAQDIKTLQRQVDLMDTQHSKFP